MTTYNRTDVVVRLVQIADHATADDVGCFFTWPGDLMTDVCLWFGSPEGTTSNESMGRNGLRRDEFTVPCSVSAFGFSEAVDAARAAESAMSAFETLVRKMPRLRDDSLIGAGDPDAYGSEVTVKFGAVTGPTPLVRYPDETSVAGFGMQADLVCSVIFTPND